MKLSELLTQVTALPWSDDPCHDDAPDFLHPPNWDYARHAANTFPHVVAAIRNVVAQHDKYTAKGNCQCGNCKILKAALSLAEEVKT